MTEPTSATPIKATLIDITKCIGCRACQVACKQWNDREGEYTELDYNLGFQNPATLSAKTLTLITYHELPDEKAPGGACRRWNGIHLLQKFRSAHTAPIAPISQFR